MPPVHFEQASVPEETDVAIIGSGITGCSVAKHLLEHDPNVRVAILEARDVCSGATGRNGGHIQAVPEHTYTDNIATLGLELTRQIMHFTLANVDALLDLAASFSTELQKYSEVRKVDSFNLFTDQVAFEQFRDTVHAFDKDNPDLQDQGSLVSATELTSEHGVQHAIGGYISKAGAAWPYRLITGILSELLAKHSDRFIICPHAPVTAIGRESDGLYRIATSRGTVRAHTVIHATNGHAGHLLPGIRGKLFPVKGQMSTQTPTRSFAEKYKGMRSWSAYYDVGFDYVTQSGQTGEIFHGGGLAQSTARGLAELGNTRDDLNSIQSMAHLGGVLNATFGLEPEYRVSSGIKSAWTGVMGFTDGLPLVGRLPREATERGGDGEWIAAGYNGYGMANAWLCGKPVAAEKVLGRDNVEPVPRAYGISSERLAGIKVDTTVRQWLAYLGLD